MLRSNIPVDGVTDMTMMDHQHEASVLQNLQQRFAADQIYVCFFMISELFSFSSADIHWLDSGVCQSLQVDSDLLT